MMKLMGELKALRSGTTNIVQPNDVQYMDPLDVWIHLANRQRALMHMEPAIMGYFEEVVKAYKVCAEAPRASEVEEEEEDDEEEEEKD